LSLPLLVDFDRAKRHVYASGTDDDDLILTKLEHAGSIVMDYMKLSATPAAWDVADTSPQEIEVPPNVQAVTLLVLGSLYKDRESDTANVLSDTIKNLLRRLRDPALA
jgi:hypothetical protein